MLKKAAKYAFLLTFIGLGAAPASAELMTKVSTKSVSFNLAQKGAVTCYQTTASENKAAVAATNATRRARGLVPLRANAELAVVAARHACDMARRGVMSHTGSRTRGPMQRLKNEGYRPRIAAENIAAGPFTQQRVLQEWTRSSGHLANILIPQIRHYGIGRAVGADGKTVFWTAVYSAPR
jgi:uncharacterized protein YkwD